MKRIYAVLIALFLLAGSVLPALSQAADYSLRLRRDFGYGNGSDVNGSMHLELTGDAAKIKSVTYVMDDKPLPTITAAPFVFRFSTNSYATGWHTFKAIVEKTDGTQVTTQTISANFLSQEETGATMSKIIVPLIAVVIIITVAGIFFQTQAMRSNKNLAPGAPRNYGIKGGTICPRCGRAYAIHFTSINLIGGVLDRCDYCGKWAFVRARSKQDLYAAEQAELRAAQAAESGPIGNGAPESEEERLRKLLDESRYQEH